MTVPVLTISSRVPHEPYYFYPQFLESCKRQNFAPVFIPCNPYCGLMSKPKYLLKYLETEKASHVIVSDAWDILFLTTPEDILYNHKAFGECVVFNAERNCFPRADLATSPQFASDGPYRYLNSGFIVGPTELLIQMLREMKLDTIPDDTRNEKGEWTCFNDQEFYMIWYLGDSKVPRKLDTSGVLCQSLHDSGPNEFAYRPDTKRVVSLLTGNQPCVVHGNGTGKDWLRKFITWLNL